MCLEKITYLIIESHRLGSKQTKFYECIRPSDGADSSSILGSKFLRQVFKIWIGQPLGERLVTQNQYTHFIFYQITGKWIFKAQTMITCCIKNISLTEINMGQSQWCTWEDSGDSIFWREVLPGSGIPEYFCQPVGLLKVVYIWVMQFRWKLLGCLWTCKNYRRWKYRKCELVERTATLDDNNSDVTCSSSCIVAAKGRPSLTLAIIVRRIILCWPGR